MTGQWTEAEWREFCQLRQELFAGIKKTLAEDGHCKSYEGQFHIVFPNYFQDANPGDQEWLYAIRLDCYVIGPGRHYSWEGRTFNEALQKAKADLQLWIKGEWEA